MAASDNQGLQIALIVFVILTIMLSVATFMLFNSAQDAELRSQADREEATRSMAAVRANEEEIEQLKRLIGVDPGLKLPDVQRQASEDMERFAATVPEEQRFYRPALEYLAGVLRGVNSELVDEKSTTLTLAARNEERDEIKQSQIDEHSKHADEARADLAKRTQDFAEARAELERRLREREQEVQQLRTQTETATAASRREIDDLTAQLRLKEEQLKKVLEEIEGLRQETFEVADGYVREVDARRGLVWIDLGEADHLRRQVTFSVFGPDANNFRKIVRKGAIEVTQILGPHLAEARITEDTILDPFIRGDQIHTPLWKPGRPERFALAGFMDLDDDDQSDRDRVRDLITMAGGLSDAELTDTGETLGAMTLDTRYLVLGQSRPEVEQGLGEWEAKAQELGVERISLSRFLDYVGWTDPERTLRYGRSRPSEYAPAEPDGGRPVSSGVLGEQFQPRRPRSQGGSTYRD